MKKHYIYFIHNLLNNKVYVGQSVNPKKRWKKHLETAFSSNKKRQYPVHKSIAKYGVATFQFSIIQELNNLKDCNEAEIYWILFFNCINSEHGYNLTTGGDGTPGRVVSLETREKLRQHNLGKKSSQETKNKISKSNKGKRHSLEARNKISKSAIGRKLSNETIINMTGENSVCAKLTLANVQEIRNTYPNYSLVEYAKKFNVSDRTIARVVYNIDWYDKKYNPPTPRKINSNGRPKLSFEKAEEIRELYKQGKNLSQISKIYNVTKVNIGMIVKNRIWKKNV